MKCGCGTPIDTGEFCSACSEDLFSEYSKGTTVEYMEMVSDYIESIEKELSMQITETKVFKLQDQSGNLKAFAKIVLDEVLVVADLKVMNGQNGLFVSFPSKKNEKDGKWYDSVFPLTAEFRKYITDVVLKEYGASESAPTGAGQPVHQPNEPAGAPAGVVEEEELPF